MTDADEIGWFFDDFDGDDDFDDDFDDFDGDDDDDDDDDDDAVVWKCHETFRQFLNRRSKNLVRN